jgi:hypothetical protein
MAKKSKSDNAVSGKKPDVVVEEVLRAAGFKPERLKDENGFRVPFEDDGSGPRVMGLAFVIEDEGRFLFYLAMQRRIPNDALERVGEFINRINFGITIGNFEMNYEDRIVRFKCSVDYHGGELSGVLVRNVILAAMEGTEAYASALDEVFENKKGAKEAAQDLKDR